MAAVQTQIRRGTASQCDLLTPADGEVIWDKTNNRTRVGDGVKAGGYHQASAADIQGQKFVYATAVSGTNDIVLTVTQPPGSYAAGQAFEFKAANTSTNTVRVDVGPGLVAVHKFQAGSLVACGSGDLTAGVTYRVTHNGTVWQLSAGGAGVASVTGSGGITSSGGLTPNITLNTNNALGVGATVFAAGPSVTAGATTAGTNLYFENMVLSPAGSGGTFIKNPGSQFSGYSGTWRNVGGFNTAAGWYTMWQRTA